MCDGDDGTREPVQELFEPVNGFGIKMVGRFVQQQHVRLGKEKAAKCDTSFFST